VSAPRTLHATVPPSLRGARLDVAALEALRPEVSRSRLQAWIRAGRMKVEGSVERRPGLAVEEGWTLELDPPAPEAPAPGSALEPRLLREDEHIVLLDKPAGLPMHGTSPGDARPSVAHWLVARYGERLPIGQGADRPGIVHRLDRDTSGVCVAARTREALEDLMSQFAERSVEKEYLALCYGVPRFRSDWVDARLAPDPHKPNRQRVTRSEEPDTRDALTYWEVAERFDGFALLRVRPRTGRRHQVRVHLAAADLPLIGDPLYHARNFGPGRLPAGAPMPERTLLHAARLACEHPATGERVIAEAPLPADMAALLEALRASAPARERGG
jgi:23S rRNA pseudouridine1911/1915/1917 synthase